MKNCLLLIPACLLGLTAAAQPEKGQHLLNLAGRYNFGKTDHLNRSSSFVAHLGVGYFVTNRLALGIQAETDHDFIRFNRPGYGGQYISERLHQRNRLGAMARYYFPTGKKTAFFLHANAGFEQQYTRYEVTDESTSQATQHWRGYPNRLFVGVTPGFAWFPAKRVAVEATLLTVGYRHALSGPRLTGSRMFGFIDGLNPRLGISILLGGSKPAPAIPE